MSDVLNSQGDAQATWNRVPLAARVLLYVLGAAVMVMIGYRLQVDTPEILLMMIMRAILGAAFFLMADIDCPGGNLIRVAPGNLIALAATLG